jgi:hypothetical protein
VYVCFYLFLLFLFKMILAQAFQDLAGDLHEQALQLDVERRISHMSLRQVLLLVCMLRRSDGKITDAKLAQNLSAAYKPEAAPASSSCG